jgi:N-formylglutamate amidohydrolase
VKLPILLSVPHAGWKIPPEVSDICILTEKDIHEDGDGGASEIYYPLEEEVEAFVTTDIGRAIVDMNRAADDFWKDGVIKTHTCWEVPIYSAYPSDMTISKLIAKYHKPYHTQLSSLAKKVKIGIDCHTMAAVAPPIAPDSGKERPPVCLSHAEHTCPDEWIESLARCLSQTLDLPVSINEPFKGGHIIRSHAKEIPWIQLEYSRAPFISDKLKSACLLRALKEWLALLPE